MSDINEVSPEEPATAGAVHGLVCAFALLIDVLESNGALKQNQFQAVLGAVLKQPGIGSNDADVVVLEQIMALLQAPERKVLTVITGGKS
jgi:hypothetical protein